MHKSKAESIRARRLNEYISKRQEEEERLLNYKFKAKDVPATVANHNSVGPRASRVERKTQFKSNLYDKHREKARPKERSPEVNKEVSQKFRSKPLPSFYADLTPYTDVEKQKLAEKEKRVAQRKEQLIKEAALPPRMEEAIHNEMRSSSQLVELKNKLFKEHHTFKPKINKNVPKFEFDKPLELRCKPTRPKSVQQTQNFIKPKKTPQIEQNADSNLNSGFLTRKDGVFAEEEVGEGEQMVIQKHQPNAQSGFDPNSLSKSLADKARADAPVFEHKNTKKDELIRQKHEREHQLKEEKLRQEKLKHEELLKSKKEAARLFREGFKDVSKSVEMTREGLRSKIFLFEANGGYSKAVLYYEKLLKAKEDHDKGIKEVSIAGEEIQEASVEDIESDVEVLSVE